MDQSTVRHLATLCKLRLTAEQEDRATAQIERLLAHFARLDEVDTAGVEPSPYPQVVAHRLREDRPTDPAADDGAAPPLTQDEVLENAPATRQGCFLTPRMVGG